MFLIITLKVKQSKSCFYSAWRIKKVILSFLTRYKFSKEKNRANWELSVGGKHRISNYVKGLFSKIKYMTHTNREETHCKDFLTHQ